jgi:glucosamine-6-phosphate deaminase
VNHEITREELIRWCAVPVEKLAGHPGLRARFRLVADSREMGELMAEELAGAVRENNANGRPTRAIVPCGPTCWYEPFCRLVNRERLCLRGLTVFHMDECLDWQGRLLPKGHPYNFRAFMERHFYAPVDITMGGWGQDGHLAYNQARRNPYSRPTLAELRGSGVRVQDNNPDTILALAQRSFGAAYQLVPPMSVTLGVGDCLAARKVRVFSDTGAWKQTALRAALFSPPTVEYPMTLLQEHPDALVTATRETADHPLAHHPEWDFLGSSGRYDE